MVLIVFVYCLLLTPILSEVAILNGAHIVVYCLLLTLILFEVAQSFVCLMLFN